MKEQQSRKHVNHTSTSLWTICLISTNLIPWQSTISDSFKTTLDSLDKSFQAPDSYDLRRLWDFECLCLPEYFSPLSEPFTWVVGFVSTYWSVWIGIFGLRDCGEQLKEFEDCWVSKRPCRLTSHYDECPNPVGLSTSHPPLFVRWLAYCCPLEFRLLSKQSRQMIV